MRVFMLGWEFPPFISGGLGTACYGLVQALSNAGTDVIFVMPRPLSTPFSTQTRYIEPDPFEPPQPKPPASPAPATERVTASNGQTPSTNGLAEPPKNEAERQDLLREGDAASELPAAPAPAEPRELPRPREESPTPDPTTFETPSRQPASSPPTAQLHESDAKPVIRHAASAAPPPAQPPLQTTYVELRLPEFAHVSFRPVDILITDPYLSAEQYHDAVAQHQRLLAKAHGDFAREGSSVAWESDVGELDGATAQASLAPASARASQTQGHASAPHFPVPQHDSTHSDQGFIGSSAPPGGSAAVQWGPTWEQTGDSSGDQNRSAHAHAPTHHHGASQAAQAADAAQHKVDDSRYAPDLFSEVQRYADLAADIARREHFEVVHAHDWMTYPAGMAVAALRGVPLIVHVHSTEYDRAGTHVDPLIVDLERRGMHAAIKVIAVSYFTRNRIIERYGVDPAKVEVVHNAVDGSRAFDRDTYKVHADEKIVLFLGRITHQKGPEYFLAAARKVLEVFPKVKFIMAGAGDLTRQTVELAQQMGIGDKVILTGFLRGRDVERVMQSADLYVMPSVSEPFGITPLEAMRLGVPVLISRQSGVSEVLSHALKADFWDTLDMANKIIAVLKHPPLADTLRHHGAIEVQQITWSDAANACLDIYDEAIHLMTEPSAEAATTAKG